MDITTNTSINKRETHSALRGSYLHGIDEKQRLIIPSRWRQALGNPKSLCVLPNLDDDKRCLLLMSEHAFNRRCEGPTSAALGDTGAMDLLVNLGALTDTPLLDSHGRIRICEWQLEHVGISKQVRMIGAGAFAQLWDPDSCKIDPLSKLSELAELSKKYNF